VRYFADLLVFLLIFASLAATLEGERRE